MATLLAQPSINKPQHHLDRPSVKLLLHHILDIQRSGKLVLIEGVGVDGGEKAVVFRGGAHLDVWWQGADAPFDEVSVR